MAVWEAACLFKFERVCVYVHHDTFSSVFLLVLVRRNDLLLLILSGQLLLHEPPSVAGFLSSREA